MDPQSRRVHVRYFRKCLDFGFSAQYTALDTSRMSLVYFCVVALDLMGALEEDVHTLSCGQVVDAPPLQYRVGDDSDEARTLRARIVDWVYACQVHPGSSSGAGGFCGGTSSGVPFRPNPLNAPRKSEAIKTLASPSSSSSLLAHEEPAHIAMTYTALAILVTLGNSLDGVNKDAVSKGLAALQRKDGSFQAMPSDSTHGYQEESTDNADGNDQISSRSTAESTATSATTKNSSSSAASSGSYNEFSCSGDGIDSSDSSCLEADTRFVYAACCTASLLKDWRGINPTICKRYLRSCLAPMGDGGFALTPGQEAHGGSTFTATAALALLGERLTAEQPQTASTITALPEGRSHRTSVSLRNVSHSDRDSTSRTTSKSSGDNYRRNHGSSSCRHNKSVLAAWEREDLIAWCLRRQANPPSQPPNNERGGKDHNTFGAQSSSDNQGREASEAAAAAAVDAGRGRSSSNSSNVQGEVLQPPGGFTGRVNKAPDTCYSFWVGGTLALLGEFHLVHCESVSAFIASCENLHSGGGFSKSPGETPDLLHSFYSLLFKSLAGHPGFHELHVALAIRKDRVEAHWSRLPMGATTGPSD